MDITQVLCVWTSAYLFSHSYWRKLLYRIELQVTKCFRKPRQDIGAAAFIC